MFFCRNNELEMIEDLYKSSKFEFLVLYGRRRVGKTSLLQEFSNRHKTLFFSAQEKNDALNLEDFSAAEQYYFSSASYGAFSGWENAFKYISDNTKKQKTVIIIDEFSYIVKENPSIKSILQHTIDHSWKNKNIFLILCGSSVSFMKGEVLSKKSPLYGRTTAQYELKSFDYLDSAKFFPNYSNVNKLIAYGILGGIPSYLEAFNSSASIEKNIETQILHDGAFLKEEPQFFLRQELREPSLYNSIFETIAGGATRLNDIATRIHEEATTCSKYLGTLQTIKLVTKCYPCGEKENSKKTIYKITDNYFSFWYHFLFKKKSYYEILGPKDSAAEIMRPENLNTHLGFIFEGECLEYMIRIAKQNKLPFVPSYYGKWWGTNPERKVTDDIDILMMDEKKEKYIFCECKFKNEKFSLEEFETMISRKKIFSNIKKVYFYAFSKSGFSSLVQKYAVENNVTLVTVDDMFDFKQCISVK